jgi:hypothetical protein
MTPSLIEIRKEKQLDLIKSICKTCFNNNVHDSIKVNDENTFSLKITRPNDTIRLSHLLFTLEDTPVRDIRFSSAQNGIQMMFSTTSMLPTDEEHYNRIKSRQKLTFTPPQIVNITPNLIQVSEIDQLWINTTSEFIIKNLPIPIETGVIAFREQCEEINTWLHGCLNQVVTLKDLKTCMSIDGVRDIELSIKNGELQIKVYCGIEKISLSRSFKQNKHVRNYFGEDVISPKPNVRRIVREGSMNKRHKHQRSYYVKENDQEEESTYPYGRDDGGSSNDSDGSR